MILFVRLLEVFVPNTIQENHLQKGETPDALFRFLYFTLLLKECAIFVVLRWVPYWYGYLHYRSHVIHVFQRCDEGNSLTFTITCYAVRSVQKINSD